MKKISHVCVAGIYERVLFVIGLGFSGLSGTVGPWQRYTLYSVPFMFSNCLLQMAKIWNSKLSLNSPLLLLTHLTGNTIRQSDTSNIWKFVCSGSSSSLDKRCKSHQSTAMTTTAVFVNKSLELSCCLACLLCLGPSPVARQTSPDSFRGWNLDVQWYLVLQFRLFLRPVATAQKNSSDNIYQHRWECSWNSYTEWI